jgi:hypothetical protein
LPQIGIGFLDRLGRREAAGGEKATQKGNSSAVVIAKILLRELANAGEAQEKEGGSASGAARRQVINQIF